MYDERDKTVFVQIDNVQQPHDTFINLWQIVFKLTTINCASSHFQ